MVGIPDARLDAAPRMASRGGFPLLLLHRDWVTDLCRRASGTCRRTAR